MIRDEDFAIGLNLVRPSRLSSMCIILRQLLGNE